MLDLTRRAVLLGGVLLGMSSAVAAEQPFTVFAAASLKTALDEANRLYTAQTGIAVRASYAASSALAAQIAHGAPADVYASADLDWMNELEKSKLIVSGTRIDLLSNQLVVIAARESPISSLALDASTVTSALAGGRLAVAEVTSVPAGRYAKAALQSLGLWDTVSGHLAMAENVRAALRFVARGEAPLGIVYASDAAAEPAVKTVATFPATSHPAIVYPFAVTASGNASRGKAYLQFLQGPSARAAFEKQGFLVLGRGT